MANLLGLAKIERDILKGISNDDDDNRQHNSV